MNLAPAVKGLLLQLPGNGLLPNRLRLPLYTVTIF